MEDKTRISNEYFRTSGCAEFVRKMKNESNCLVSKQQDMRYRILEKRSDHNTELTQKARSQTEKALKSLH
jgi:hypothetical protein